jgi:Protein of unknown function (DUF692)
VVQHGESLDIAGPDPLDREYLKRLLAELKSPWVSDHFYWSAAGAHLADLLPIPYTNAVTRVVERTRQVPLRPFALSPPGVSFLVDESLSHDRHVRRRPGLAGMQ